MINKQAFRLKKNGESYWNCFCRNPELIENYDRAIADEEHTWDCHHRKEEFYSYKELKERGEYYDVSPDDLIFLTREEHNKIDSCCKRNGEAHRGKTQARSKKVLCIETGEIFESTYDVERKTGINHGTILWVCNGSRSKAAGYHWRYV